VIGMSDGIELHSYHGLPMGLPSMPAAAQVLELRFNRRSSPADAGQCFPSKPSGNMLEIIQTAYFLLRGWRLRAKLIQLGDTLAL